jgi:hypothetical protein
MPLGQRGATELEEELEEEAGILIEDEEKEEEGKGKDDADEVFRQYPATHPMEQ